MNSFVSVLTVCSGFAATGSRGLNMLVTRVSKIKAGIRAAHTARTARTARTRTRQFHRVCQIDQLPRLWLLLVSQPNLAP